MEVIGEDLAVVLLGNGTGAFYSLQESILGYLLGVPGRTSAKKNFESSQTSYDYKTLEQYAGRYFSADTVTYQSFTKDIKNLTELVVDNDSLKWKWGSELIPLEYIRPGVFKDRDYDIYLEFADSDEAADLLMHVTYNYQVECLIKDTQTRWKPTTNELQEFVGEYFSPHLYFYWRIELNTECKLVVIRPTIQDTLLEPDTSDTFLIWIEQYPGQQFDSYVRFHRENDKVSHLTISNPRLMGHRFDKVK